MRASDGLCGVLKQPGHDGAAFCQQAWLRRWFQQGCGIPLALSDSARRGAAAAGHQRVPVQPPPRALLEVPCSHTHTQRALIAAARARNGVRGPRLERWYLRFPLVRHSLTSQASSPGRWRLLSHTGLLPTRTRTAANCTASKLFVPCRHVTSR